MCDDDANRSFLSLYLRIVCLLLTRVNGAGHINNLYNTTFWAMVQRGGMGTTEAEAELKVRL